MPGDNVNQDPILNHLGQCVADPERSCRFYTEVLGFERWRDLRLPDEPSNKLLRIAPPLGLRAVYLRRGDFVLELLSFERSGNPPYRERVMNEPGLTHLSFSVDDVEETCRAVVAAGGEVLEDTKLGGLAVFVRDPDGQLIELLPMSYRQTL